MSMDPELADTLLHDMSRRVPSDLIAFGRALEQADCLPDGWPYFLERAAKWSDEYVRWCNLGKPCEGDRGWNEWVAAMPV